MAKKKTPRRALKKPESGSKSASAGRNQLLAWVVNKPIIAAIGILFLLITIFFFDTIFGGKIYFSPDAFTPAAMGRPLQKYLFETGEVPQWLPTIFGGMPSYGSLSFTPYGYFPDAIFMWLDRLVDLPRMLVYVLHYVLAGAGVFLFLRRKGADFIPAFSGGVAFMLMPYLITMIIFGHGSQIMTAAYIPLALWAVDRLLERTSLLNLGLTGLIVGLMLQRGHVQVAYYGLMLIGLYLLWHVFTAVRAKNTASLVPCAGGFIAALAIGLAFSAILYLPLQEYTPYSIRGAASALQPSAGQPQDTGVGFEYATQWSFSPGEMMTFLIPSFFGFGGVTYWGDMPFTDYPNYMGILVLALAIVALVKRVPLAGFFGTSIVLALLISFGYHFEIFYRLFYDYFPYFDKFRVPVMILVLVQCCMAILAGLGMQALLQAISKPATKEQEARNAKTVRHLWMAVGVALGLALIFSLARDGFFSLMQGFYPDRYEFNTQVQLDRMRFDMLLKDVWVVSLVLSGGLALAALAFSRKIKPGLAVAGAAALIIVDLWLVDKNIGTEPIAESRYEAQFQAEADTRFLLQDSSQYRIYPAVDMFADMRWAAQGIESVGGYHAAKPRRFQDLLEATNLQGGLINDYFRIVNRGSGRAIELIPVENIPPVRRTTIKRMLDLLNVKYLLSPAPLPEPEWRLRTEVNINYGGGPRRLMIYENTTMLPRAYLVGEYEVYEEDQALLARLNSADFNPHHTVLLQEPPRTPPQPDSAAQARLEQFALHEITITTSSQAPQVLVLSDNHFPPGWQAFIDGSPVPTRSANYCFRAVEVPPGQHRIIFRYQSRAFVTGAMISLTALFLCIGLIVYGHQRERKALVAAI